MDRLDAIFDAIDADKSGEIDQTELIMHLLGLGQEHESVSELFAVLDADGDGLISREEFIAGFDKLTAKLSRVTRGPRVTGGPESGLGVGTTTAKAEEIFDFFARGKDRLSLNALIALHRITEDSGMSDSQLKEAFSRMLGENYPNDFDSTTGLTKKGLVHSYTSGLAGDVNTDYSAIMGGGLESYRKAEFIFEYFASGSQWISFSALFALHRATDDSGTSEAAFSDFLCESVLPEHCAPDEWGPTIGMEKGAFIRSYLEGWSGSPDDDYDMINEGRLDFFVKAERSVHDDAAADPELAAAAVKACHSEEKRAKHGYQLIMSFGARGNDDGSPLEIDGIKVGSGIDVVNYLHNFLCHWLFGSLKEGTRHIYYDFYNLRGLPGTREVPKPKGEGVMRLNPAWKPLYKEAFGEARIIIFIISTSWLESPNCHEEFSWLLDLIKADPSADKEVFFWILDKRVLEHPNWPALYNNLNQLCVEIGAGEGMFDEFIMPFVTQEDQDRAIMKMAEYVTRLCSVWPQGTDEKKRITQSRLEKNFMKGMHAGIPGFDT